MHSQGRVIHTGMLLSNQRESSIDLCRPKVDNIMVAFEEPSTIDRFLQGQTSHPMARKHVGDHVVYCCHNDFGPVFKGLGTMIPQITDFGLAQPGGRAEPLILPMSPTSFAPQRVFSVLVGPIVLIRGILASW
jgi:hypothetical protein